MRINRRLTRHAFVKIHFAIGLVIACATLSLLQTAHAAEAKKPNVLVILADDLGYADIGAQNLSKDVRTPNIDTIAKNGVRFTHGYVSCPVCSPTRAGFLTGRYQERFGHEFNPGPTAADNFGLPLDQITIAQQMKKVGYVTGMVGKWHEGNKPEFYPTRRGFDEFFGFLGGAHSYVHLKPEGKNAIMRNDKPVTEDEYLTDAFSREAVAFIDKHHSDPFFLYVPFNAVHNPQECPQKYLDRFPDESDKKRKYLLAMLSAEDDAVGKILEKVREHKLEENTLIFFFSDNGGPTEGNGSRNTPLSGFKGQVWEGGIREPFMAQWKGKIPAGRVLDQPVISLDIFATALTAVGGEIPKDRVIDGVDIMPLMKGETSERPHETLYWRFGQQWAIRDGDMKLVQFGKTDMQLFDLDKDISEKHDLAKEKPEVVKQMKEKYDAWSAQLMKPRWGAKAKFDEKLDADAKQEGKAGRKHERKAGKSDDSEN